MKRPATPLKERKPESLATRLGEFLRSEIVSGAVKPGERLPSETELTRTHSVSRTVVREAIAALRFEGLVEARRGSGVYALDYTQARTGLGLAGLDTGRITGAIELLEIRIAVEIRSAGLAAIRRSNLNIDTMLAKHRILSECHKNGEPTREADFQFHYAIAEGTQNTLYPQFLTLILPGMIPRTQLGNGTAKTGYARNPALLEEHRSIVEAIIEQDSSAAEAAMEQHLEGNLTRYRAILRESMTQ